MEAILGYQKLWEIIEGAKEKDEVAKCLLF